MLLARVRSFLFVLWLLVTVVPVALAVLIASIFVRGDPLYWLCVFWLQTVSHWERRSWNPTTFQIPIGP